MFFSNTTTGIAPQTFIAVNTGVTISQLSDALLEKTGNPLLNVNTIITLFGIALLALLPTFLKRRVEEQQPEVAESSQQQETSKNK